MENSVKKQILLEAESISSWSEWTLFEKRHFPVEEWRSRSTDELGFSLKRDPLEIESVFWESMALPYKIDWQLADLHDQVRELVFEKLEPEASLENLSHPDAYGKACYHCERWARNYLDDRCPICGAQLRRLPLNERENE